MQQGGSSSYEARILAAIMRSEEARVMQDEQQQAREVSEALRCARLLREERKAYARALAFPDDDQGADR
jgi:hypothetical protein